MFDGDEIKKFFSSVFDIKIISEKDADKIITTHKPFGNFLIFKKNLYMAIDNTKGNILIANFLSLEKAFLFLKTDIFVEELKGYRKI